MESLEIAGFKKEELTVDMAKAQLLSLIYFIPMAIVLGLPYYYLWAVDYNLQTIIDMVPAKLSMFMTTFAIFGVLIVGIVLHELIHGLTWSMFAKAGFKSIRFGVVWKFVTPYCHCKEPLQVKHYMIGALMPALVLGIIPSVIALVTGNLFLFVFGLFFTLAAGGDFMIINLLRRVDYTALVQDHPSKIGCYIYKAV